MYDDSAIFLLERVIVEVINNPLRPKMKYLNIVLQNNYSQPLSSYLPSFTLIIKSLVKN